MPPVLSFSVTEEQEKHLNRGTKTAVSAHGVRTLKILKTNGTTQQGFFKPCTPDTYPILLAKYVVAFSVIVRAALGERASEDRLVYNAKGIIIGTVSFAVPNFIPLLTKTEPDYTDEKLQKLAKPNKKMLLKKNVAADLTSMWKNKCRDRHPKNVSVNGIIDWDELHYELTSILKDEPIGSRWWIDSPKRSSDIKGEDIQKFPNQPGRRHWPTHFPNNWNYWKAYKTTAFYELEGDAKFKKQFLTAILKELLAYNKKMLQERLQLYLGDAGLNLDELSAEKRKKLLNYNNELLEERMLQQYGLSLKDMSPHDRERWLSKLNQLYSLFHDNNDKELSFIEHCSRFFELEHQKFTHEVLKKTPEFREFLIGVNKTPEIFQEIKKWFTSSNETNRVPYDLAYITQLYHCIWRESFSTLFDYHLKSLHDKIDLPRDSAPENHDKPEDFEYKFEKINSSPQLFIADKGIDLGGSIISVGKPIPKKTEILTIADVFYQKIKQQASDLYQTLSTCKKTYYLKYDLSIKDNHTFIDEMQLILKNAESDRMLLRKSLEENKEILKQFKDINGPIDGLIIDMNELFEDISKFTTEMLEVLTTFRITDADVFKSELPITPPSPSIKPDRLDQTPTYANYKSGVNQDLAEESKKIDSSSSVETLLFPALVQPDLTPTIAPVKLSSIPDFNENDGDLILDYSEVKLATSESEQLDLLSKRLAAWISTVEDGIIKKIIREAHKDYDPKNKGLLIGWVYGIWRRRGAIEEIEQLPLNEIFAEHGWYATSLNTGILKRLCLEMAYENQDDATMLFLNKKDDAWWEAVAQEIAQKSGLKKPEKTLEPILSPPPMQSVRKN